MGSNPRVLDFCYWPVLGQQQAVPAMQEDSFGLRSYIKNMPYQLAIFIQFWLHGLMMDAGKVHGGALACESFSPPPDFLSNHETIDKTYIEWNKNNS